MMNVLNEDILDSPQHFTYVVIDDLDREWADEEIANMLIRCLFQVVLSLQRVRHLKVIVALRTNILEALDFGITGGQEEKYRAATIRLSWSKAELTESRSRRTRVAAAKHEVPGLDEIRDLLPPTNKTRGDALQFLLERTLMRPRDAIAFLNECLELAGGKSRLTWSEINSAEGAYSKSRLLALRDEWKPTYPGIDLVFQQFAGSPAFISPELMTKRLDDCVLLTSEVKFAGTVWMTEKGAPVWEGNGDDWAEIYQPLIRLLYNIGFLGASRIRQTCQYTAMTSQTLLTP